ncbi:MAG: Rieske 2Fe-2S domain-containing protein [Chthoniobacteraceae bacterium]
MASPTPSKDSWLTSPSLDRRTFVSQFILGSAASLIASKVWSGRVLGSILEGPAGVLKLKVSEYPALAGEGGSIQLNFTGSSAHPLMVNRGPGNAFYALDSDCQHLHCVVPPFDPMLGAIRCGCHGSRYAIDGSLLGGPATRGLNGFVSAFDGVDTLSINIPGLYFSTELAIQTREPALRLRLNFNILPYSTYRVYFQPELTAAPQVIPFATTPDGVTNMTSAFTTTSPTTIYVDAPTPRGFYTVALVATPY